MKKISCDYEEKNVEKKNVEEIKENKDIILLIMNCLKYKEKSDYQKKTWLLNLPKHIRYYHVIGIPELNNPYVFDNENNILYISCQDDYCNLPKKVIRSYEAIYETFDFKYIFKTDDDQIVSDVNFFNILSEILKNKEDYIHYGGNVITIKLPQISTYNMIHNELPNNILIKPTKYCNGRFYFLSKKAISFLITKKILIDKEYIEDYSIGFYLDKNMKDFMLFLNTDNYFRDFKINTNKIVKIEIKI